MKRYKILLPFIFTLLATFQISAQSKYSDFAESQKEKLFHDDFSSNRNSWLTGYGTDYNGKIENGYYSLDNNSTTSVKKTTKYVTVNTSKDFEIEGNFKIASTGSEGRLQSLIWGRSTEGTNYFGFTKAGDFRISKYEKGDGYTAYKDFTTSSYLHTYSYNKMTIRKVKSTMYFFINENLVHSMPFVAFYGNEIGFEAASGSELSMDYLNIYYLNKEKPVSTNAAVYNSYGYSQRNNLYYDSYNDNYHNWTVGTGTNYSAKINNGYYEWEHTASSGTADTDKEIVLDTKKDFEIEASYKKASGSDSYLQSIIFGCSIDENNYFGFTGSGKYRISKYEGGEFSAYKDFTESAYINAYSYNKLTVRKVNSQVYFFLNEHLVHTMPFTGFYGNKIGIQAASAKLNIDYFRVSYLTKNPSSYNFISYSDRTNLFYDSFNDNSNDWSSGSDAETNGYVSNGYYHWSTTSEKSAWTTSKTIELDEARDFEIEAKIKYQSGKTNSGIMLTWGRSSDSGNNYNMEFTANGKYWIGKYEDGSYVEFKGWTEDSSVSKYDYNKMTIRKVGADYYFFINEKLVHTASFQAFYGDRVGFTVPSTTAMRVDYLRASYLDKEKKKDDNVYTYNTPPKITITEPSGVASRGFDVVEAKSTKVAGTVFDTDGIYKVEVNGTKATLDKDGSFYAYVYLGDGSNNIKVVATDNKFKATTEEFKLKLDEPDPKPIDGGGTIASGEKRLALVIGNSNYLHGGTLRNPVNDARSMQTSLEKLGFKVLKYENCDQATIKRAIDDFGRQLQGYDVGLFFYAGHGLQVNGSNFLVPTDAKIEHEDEVEYDCVMADRVLAKMESSKTKTNLVILDACRNNPFERSWSRSGGNGKGLAFMNAPVGSLIAYATSPGNTASDGSGSNGLYTEALLSEIDKPSTSIMEMFQKVRKKVVDQSQGKQIPWESTSLRDNFYFKK